MANIKSVNGNPIVLDGNGFADGAVTQAKLVARAVTVDKQAWGGTPVELTLIAGYFNTQGTVHTQSSTSLEYYNEPIEVHEGETLRVSFTTPDGSSVFMWGAFVEYVTDGTRTGRTVYVSETASSFEFDYTPDKGVVSVSFCFRSYGYQSRFVIRRMTPIRNVPRSALNANGVGRVCFSTTYNGWLTDGNNNYIGMPCPVDADGGEVYTTYVGYSDNKGCNIYVTYFDSAGANIRTDEFVIATGKLPAVTFKTPSTCSSVYVCCWNSGGLTLDDSASITLNKGVRHMTSFEGSDEGRIALLEGAVESDVEFTTAPGYYTDRGAIVGPFSPRDEVHTGLIPMVYSSIRFEVEHEEAHELWVACALFDERGQYMSRYDFPRNVLEVYGLSGTLGKEQLEGVGYFSLCWRTYSDSTMHIFGMVDSAMVGGGVRGLGGLENPFIDKPVYDHLFVSSDPITIPHESIYHVRLSGRLGYKVIEANIAATSDGVFIVNHLQGGKFGRYFEHVDGETDISNTSVSSVTWDWIAENVRYVSTIPRYRTRPCRLEEFLAECRKVGVIPFATSSNPDAVKMVEDYMGRDNYIAYGGNRSTSPSAIIYHWVSKTTKQEIVDYCESIGRPFIYGLANTQAFTDDQLKEIVAELHSRGYWVGCSYRDGIWSKLSSFGFDFNGSQFLCNRLDRADVVNATSVTGFSEFTVTGGVQTDDDLYFGSGGTIAPTVGDIADGVYIADIRISFDGSITVPTIGDMSGNTYTSDGSNPWFMAVPVVGGDPIATITVGSGTTIKDISYLVARA